MESTLNRMKRALWETGQRLGSCLSRDATALCACTPAASADRPPPQRASRIDSRDARDPATQALAHDKRELERSLRAAGWSHEQAKREVARRFPRQPIQEQEQ
jgi:hypothetical protein